MVMEYVYIYNLKQAYFYIKNDLLPCSIDKHHVTGKIFFKFNKEDSHQLYDQWITQKWGVR